MQGTQTWRPMFRAARHLLQQFESPPLPPAPSEPQPQLSLYKSIQKLKQISQTKMEESRNSRTRSFRVVGVQFFLWIIITFPLDAKLFPIGD